MKGALFARYSRTHKSLRRLFLDEFVGDLDLTGDLTVDATVGLRRAEELYDRVFLEYGDDSVAQLGGVHLACEQSSNLLTKILEWGRLMAYLEQSTRYIPYDKRLGGRYRYYRDRAVLASRGSRGATSPTWTRCSTPTPRCCRACSTGRASATRRIRATPTSSTSRRSRRRRATRSAGSCPRRRSRTSASTAPVRRYEALLLRMRAHPLPEARAYAAMMLEELRKVIPSFLTRVDRADRGVAWSAYLAETRHVHPGARRAHLRRRAGRAAARGHAHRLRPRGRGQGPRRDLLPADAPPRGPGAGEGAHARRRRPRRAAARVRRGAPQPSAQARARVRAHRLPLRRRSPTTARSATCNVTACSPSSGSRCRPRHGYEIPEAVEEAGLREQFDDAMERSAALYDALLDPFPEQAPYAVSLAYRHAVRDADERARGDAPARAAHRAAGPPVVPADRARRCTA